jgi:hypothetical protein
MKKYSTYLLTAVVVLALAMTMTACTKSSSSDNGGTASSVTGTTQGKQAASSGTQGANMGSGSATTFQNLGQIGLSSTVGAPPMKIAGAHTLDPGLAKSAKLSAKLAKSKALNKAVSAFKKARALGATQTIPSTSVDCADGGTITFSGQYDDVAGTFDLTLTAANCKEDGTKIDGTISLNATISSSGDSFTITETLGTSASKLTLLEFSDLAYSVLVSKMETVLTLTLSGSATGGVMTTVTMGANGTMTVKDYLNQGTYAMTFTNMSIVVSDTAATSGVVTLAITVDGGFSESWTDASVTNGVSMTFSQFAINDVFASASAAAFDETISGGFSIDFTPDNCFEGSYVFETVTPIHYKADGTTSAGQLKINTVVVVVYNSSGTITVTMDGTQVYSGDEYGLATVCEFQTLDEPAPSTSGDTGTASGNSMTVTSVSSIPAGGTLDCYTDLHVNYYSSATSPGASTAAWYVDWHVNDGSTIPAGSNFQQYLDIDVPADGVADVGLDINGSDYDSTSGGIEHFSAYKLPVGYYVISMNNYSCAAAVTNTVNIQIGSDVFGPYDCSYTASDGESGANSAAWCAVADVVVTSSGATVQAHAAALPLWHYGTFDSVAAPAVLKARKVK